MSEKTNWIREKACKLRKIQAKIIKSKQNKKGATNSTINYLLNCVPNFIGCFAEDELSSMMFNSFPCFLIVNIDPAHMTGSHWLALGIFRDRIEIFDPLGFNFFNWSRVPCNLFKLLHRLSQSRRILVSKRIQSDDSVLCAFYCIYYCIFRRTVPFSKICHPFKHLKQNDKVLIKLFSYVN